MPSTSMLRVDGEGLEYKCRHCDEFWPIDADHWVFQGNGYVRTDKCRACRREDDRVAKAIARLDEGYRQRNIVYCRRYYRHYFKKSEPELLEAYDRRVRALEAARIARRRQRAA